MELEKDGSVKGNECDRGLAYAAEELRSPKRLFTGTVRLAGAVGGLRLCPVKTSAELPRALLQAVAKACRRVRAVAPIVLGEVVCADVAGSGVDLVATSSIAGDSHA